MRFEPENPREPEEPTPQDPWDRFWEWWFMEAWPSIKRFCGFDNDDGQSGPRMAG